MSRLAALLFQCFSVILSQYRTNTITVHNYRAVLFFTGRDVDDLCLWDADGREMTWTDAVDVCDEWGGSLLRIMSPDEQSIFTTINM